MNTDTVLSILVLALFGVTMGAFALWRRGGQTKQALLMLLLAVIVAGNIALWVWPDSRGQSLVNDRR